MADSLAISSINAATLAQVSAVVPRQTTAVAPTPTSAAPAADTASSIVNLSAQGQSLSSAAQPNQPASPSATASDVEAANMRTQSTRDALQNLLADPQRVVLRNILDPYFAGLVATARLSELNIPSPVIDPKLLTNDLPGAVSPVPAYRAIRYYQEGADLA